MTLSFKVVALEARLKSCCNVITLGVKPNFTDYSAAEAALILHARKVYYPTPFYADLFDTAGIATFPSYHTYKFVQDKIKQTALLNILGIPHPRTRVFYGKRQIAAITRHFRFPFIAKKPRGSAMGRGVFKIQNSEDLERYTLNATIAYIQEYLPLDRDIRVVVIGNRVVHAYWRIAPAGDFRTNVAVGGTVSLDPVPPAARELALDTARKCRWDDVGIDICQCNGQYYIIEANMKYGKEGFRQAGIDYIQMMESMIENGQI
jgi:ribosomal protein S6--L-glutamate ligase